MKEFACGSAAQFDWLDELIDDGMCHVFENCILPPSCTPGTARLGFEKRDDVYILYIDRGISTTADHPAFHWFLQMGEAKFICLKDMAAFLRSLQPLFEAGAPENSPQSPEPVPAAPSDREVVDLDAVLRAQEKRGKPRLVDPAQISGPLKQKIFGQDAAIDELAELVVVHKMRKQEKILTVMLLGPTSTGKSETAKSLAEILSGVYGTAYGYIEIAGSEFVGEHSVNRFFGAPPGYVGHGQPTVLAPVRQNPYHVITINEIEKSDPKLIEGLMEAIETGRLGMADNTAPIDLNRCILLFTSNLPIPMETYQAAGDFERTEICRDAFTKHCGRPEISGKIANYIVYQSLSTEANARIIIKFIRQELENYGMTLRAIDPDLLSDFLSFDTAYGARTRAGNVQSTVGRQLIRFQLDHPGEKLAGRSVALGGTIRHLQFNLE